MKESWATTRGSRSSRSLTHAPFVSIERRNIDLSAQHRPRQRDLGDDTMPCCNSSGNQRLFPLPLRPKTGGSGYSKLPWTGAEWWQPVDVCSQAGSLLFATQAAPADQLAASERATVTNGGGRGTHGLWPKQTDSVMALHHHHHDHTHHRLPTSLPVCASAHGKHQTYRTRADMYSRTVPMCECTALDPGERTTGRKRSGYSAKAFTSPTSCPPMRGLP